MGLSNLTKVQSDHSGISNRVLTGMPWHLTCVDPHWCSYERIYDLFNTYIHMLFKFHVDVLKVLLDSILIDISLMLEMMSNAVSMVMSSILSTDWDKPAFFSGVAH